nr:orf209EGC151 [uncultured bacterium]
MEFRLYPKDVETHGKRAGLIVSMKTTAVNRFNASTRLSQQAKLTFWASTIFSLGLIFIPLMQLAGVKITLCDSLLSAMQVFLAVAILVYSIIISTARFELRSAQLNDCGNSIKQLIRDLRIMPELDSGEESKLLKDFQDRYAAMVANVENHKRSDYILTILRSRDLFALTSLGRALYWFKFIIASAPSYLIPIIIVLVELVLIRGMFG